MANQEQVGTDDTASTNEIRAQLDETRERLSADVEALGNKLSPQNIKRQAQRRVATAVRRGRDEVVETAQAATAGLGELVRANPVPVALIGVGVGWLVWSARQRRGRGKAPDYAFVGRSEVYDDTALDDGADSAGGELHELKHRMQDGLTDAKRKASRTAQAAREKVGELEHAARDKLSGLEHAARDGAHRLKEGAARSLNDDPLVLGAVALGAGIVLGLSLPATESEDQLIGEYRDRLLASAKDRASKALETAGETA